MEARYGIEERVIVPAPEITAEDLVTQSDAAAMLVVKQQTIHNIMNSGSMTVVWDLECERRGGRSTRLLLRGEVEARTLGRERRVGGSSHRVAPDVDDSPAPSLDGVAYGIERRVIRSAPELTAEDLVTQSEAARLLGILRSSVNLAMNRGRFTVVWDLSRRNGSGASSARLLLRGEVEAAAGGG